MHVGVLSGTPFWCIGVYKMWMLIAFGCGIICHNSESKIRLRY